MKIFLIALMMTLAVMSSASAEIYRQGVFYVIYDAAKWRQKGQRAVTNNKIILECVREVHAPKR